MITTPHPTKPANNRFLNLVAKQKDEIIDLHNKQQHTWHLLLAAHQLELQRLLHTHRNETSLLNSQSLADRRHADIEA